jgi:uncharacterized protein
MIFTTESFVAIALCFWAAAASGATSEQTSIQARGPAGSLQGTLFTPAGKQGPVVLIIPGSGPIDRDGNSTAGVRAATYRLLAEGLATRGITTVRVDKRGMFASATKTTDANAVTIADYVADVHAWTPVIRRRARASCIWLLGHSEGGLVAMVAAKNRKDVCGLILVAAGGRPMGEVLREQLRTNPANAPLLGQALSAIDSLEAGKRVDTSSMDPALLPLFRPQVQAFLISAFSYNPAQLLSGYLKPVLILQGQHDIQVHEIDARILRQSDPRATLVFLPDVNHVLKSVTSDDVSANIATYADPDLPLAPGVIDAISRFLADKHTG